LQTSEQPRFITAAGMRFEYRLLPPRRPDLPTIVLLHEGLGCIDMWRRFPQRLADATGLGVFAWSRAGFGRSDPIRLPRPLDYLEQEAQEAMPAVLAAAGLDRVILVGHSDGGTIALLYAGGPNRERVAGLVTMAAHVFVEDVTIEGILVTKRQYETGDLATKLRRWHDDNLEGAFFGWCDTWLDPGFRDWTIEAALPAISAPALVIQGADDEYGTPAQVEAIVRGVGGPAAPLLLEGVGHAPHAEAAEAVIAAIARFVEPLIRAENGSSSSAGNENDGNSNRFR
jgi:Predicted hydrolases or acyltransferases (alpha/beta hydrolase superfamily)